jgi:sulfate/thiosulfate transport system ATP-binding protein
MSTIAIENVVKGWGRAKGVNGLTAQIEAGRLVALLGPSGSGKTTLLRMIGGLETADSGSIRFDGQDVAGLAPAERGVGFVFQSYALFRHLSVFENVAFGLRVKPRALRPSDPAIRERVNELLRRVGLEGFAQRLPHQLSGGQRQRVALARALAVEPRVLLLDEPFGALDAKVRADLRRWLRKLHEELGLTTVLVTHDQEEALELADDVIVLEHGRIAHHGSPRSLIDAPQTPFAREFVGDAQVFAATETTDSLRLGPLSLDETMVSLRAAGEPTQVVLRPNDLTVAPNYGGAANGTVRHAVYLADRVKLTVALDHGPEVVVAAPRGLPQHEGYAKHQRVYVAVRAEEFAAE